MPTPVSITRLSVTTEDGKIWPLNLVLAVVEVRQRYVDGKPSKTNDDRPQFEIKAALVASVDEDEGATS